MTDPHGPPVAVVFMSHGLWVACCPRPGCLNAEQFGRTTSGEPGGLAGGFRCRSEAGGCGLTCDARWPAQVEEIEWLLMQRPVPANRNWLPGEDLSDLLTENIAHGIAPLSPAGLDEHPGGLLLTVGGDGYSGDGIAGGALTAGTWRHELGATPGDGARTREWWQR